MSADDLTWFKSSYSSSSGDSCVEVATAPDAVRVRDSKLESSPVFAVPRSAWAGFVAYAADA
ncbi:DUF397 domain-containing protein [Streptomyces genisteinicus]|uniref:DUF397 domain-containing protein n=1 Tax=Streptomyces genisteinicus TaxID=2768068 RepID=A0A7H0HWD9_9ACTN|nr:DUF397 domain-containing protein [Streptomyces genisteinicus]QNP64855.1 DUF397 domain-containing protein [Streptomyces genisteinicus]